MSVTVIPLLTNVTLGEAADDGYWTGTDGYSSEIFRQGNSSQGWLVSKNASETGIFDYFAKASVTLDMSGTGCHLFITMRCDIAPFIDYVHFGNISIELIKNKLLEINPDYKFRFENGGHIGKDKDATLAAYL